MTFIITETEPDASTDSHRRSDLRSPQERANTLLSDARKITRYKLKTGRSIDWLTTTKCLAGYLAFAPKAEYRIEERDQHGYHQTTRTFPGLTEKALSRELAKARLSLKHPDFKAVVDRAMRWAESGKRAGKPLMGKKGGGKFLGLTTALKMEMAAAGIAIHSMQPVDWDAAKAIEARRETYRRSNKKRRQSKGALPRGTYLRMIRRKIPEGVKRRTWFRQQAAELAETGFTSAEVYGLRKDMRATAKKAKPMNENLSKTKPWERLGMSRATWYRLGQPRPWIKIPELVPFETKVAQVAPHCLMSEDEINVSVAQVAPHHTRGEGPKGEARPAFQQRDILLIASALASEAHEGLGHSMRKELAQAIEASDIWPGPIERPLYPVIHLKGILRPITNSEAA